MDASLINRPGIDIPDSQSWSVRTKTWLVQVWDAVSSPGVAVSDPAGRRQARLTITIILLVILLTLVGFIFSVRAKGIESNQVFLWVFGMLGAGYALGRSRHYRWAGLLMVMVFVYSAAIMAISTATPEDHIVTLLYMPVILLLVALLLSARMVVVGSTVVLTAAWIWVMTLPTAQMSLVQGVGMITVLAGLMIAYVFHRDAIERLRQRQISNALEASEASNHALEQVNAELATANHLAVESTRLKSEFLSTMSHELRTPLNAINGFCGIMLEGMAGEIDDEAQHMLNRIHQNGQRLLGLINDILDIAKIEAGRMDLVREGFVLTDLADRWYQQHTVLADSKGLRFSVNVDPALPGSLVGDTARLTQITTNLLSNAFKFTAEGGVRLDIKRADEQWQIVVSDTGIGIPPHALNYIFDEFRQVDGSTQRQFGGSGLGLAITRNLCRMMGGTIRVASELGKGSSFTVTLPLVAAAEQIAASPVAQPITA